MEPVTGLNTGLVIQSLFVLPTILIRAVVVAMRKNCVALLFSQFAVVPVGIEPVCSAHPGNKVERLVPLKLVNPTGGKSLVGVESWVHKVSFEVLTSVGSFVHDYRTLNRPEDS